MDSDSPVIPISDHYKIIQEDFTAKIVNNKFVLSIGKFCYRWDVNRDHWDWIAIYWNHRKYQVHPDFVSVWEQDLYGSIYVNSNVILFLKQTKCWFPSENKRFIHEAMGSLVTHFRNNRSIQQIHEM